MPIFYMFKVINLPRITVQRGITDLNISRFISIPFIFLVCFCSNFQFLLYILSLFFFFFCICIYICILFKSLFPKAFQWMVASKLFSTQFWKFQWFGIFIYPINWLVPVNSPHIPENKCISYCVGCLVLIVILIKILADVLSSYSYQWWMVC